MDKPTTPESASELRWTVHPLLEEPPAKTGLLIVVILGLSVLIAIEFSMPAYGFLSAALLTASMSRYFLPTRYALLEKHAVIAHLGARRTIPWNRIRRHTVVPDGVFLSPFAHPSPAGSVSRLFPAPSRQSGGNHRVCPDPPRGCSALGPGANTLSPSTLRRAESRRKNALWPPDWRNSWFAGR